MAEFSQERGRILRFLLAKTAEELLRAGLAELHQGQQGWPQERSFLIVPETLKADSERLYLETWPEEGLLLAEILSFRRLADRLQSLCRPTSAAPLSKAGQALLILRLLENEARYPALRSFRGRPAYALEVAEVFGDFARYRVPSGAVLDLAEREGTGRGAARLRDLASLFQDYEAERDRLGLVDRDRSLGALAALLEGPLGASERLAFLADCQVWVLGFGFLRDFTEQEYQLLGALEKRVKCLTVGLLEGPAALTEQTEKVKRRLAGLALTPLVETWAGAGRAAAAASGSVDGSDQVGLPASAEAAMAAEASVAMSTETPRRPCLQAFGCPSDEACRAFAAGEIRRLIRMEDYRRREIGLVYLGEGDLDATLRRFELDAFKSEAPVLGTSPFMQYLSAFLTLAEGPEALAPLRVMALTGLWPVNLADWDDFVALATEKGLRRADQLLFWNSWAYRGPRGERARAFAERFVAPVLEVAAELAAAKTAAAKGRALLLALAKLGVRRQLEARLTVQEEGAPTEADENSALAWRALIALLEENQRLLGDAQIEQRAWRELLLRVLLPLRPGRIPLGLDRLRVLSPTEALFYPCRALLIVGLSEGRLPAISGDEGLLSNQERAWLNERLDLALPQRKQDQARTAALLAELLPQVPAERLIVVQEGLGREDMAGILQGWLRDLDGDFANVPEALPDQRHLQLTAWREQQSRWAGRLPLYDQVSARLAEVLPNVKIDRRISAEERSIAVENLTLSPRLSSQALLASGLSISQLQRFASCGYAHFWDYLVGLSEAPGPIPDARLRGSLLHRLLELALATLRGKLALADDRESLLREELAALDRDPYLLERLLNRVLAEDLFSTYRQPEQRADLAYRLKLLLRRHLRTLLGDLQAAPYWPERLEWRFPEAGQKLAIDVGGTAFSLKGVVDRIDRSLEEPTKYRLYDYKTGAKQWRTEHLLAGLDLQLPFYAYAWQDLRPEAEIDRLAFVNLRPTAPSEAAGLRPSSEVAAPETVLSTIETTRPALFGDFAKFKMEALGASIAAGAAAARPCYLENEEAPCRVCPFAGLCLRQRRRPEERDRQEHIWTLDDYRRIGMDPDALAARTQKEKLALLLEARMALEMDPEATREATDREATRELKDPEVPRESTEGGPDHG